jgi:hypothetical protein
MPALFYAVPFVLSLAAIAAVKYGWPRADATKNPRRFRVGIITIAAGLLTAWMLPAVVALAVETMDLRGILYILCLVLSGALITGGIENLFRANQTPGQNRWEKLLEFLDHY